MTYILTKHAKERYAQRIMDRDNKTDVAVFIAQHEEKIQQDIEKMIGYGTVLYEGVSTSIANNSIVTVILNGHWVLIIDPKKNTVITLFEIDLGLGKEFNDSYIQKIREKLDEATAEYERVATAIDNETKSYQEKLNENLALIDEYKKNIKSLEKQNSNLQELINETNTNKRIAEDNVREIVGIFVGKKVI